MKIAGRMGYGVCGALLVMAMSNQTTDGALLEDHFDASERYTQQWSSQQGGSGELPVLDGAGRLFIDPGSGQSHRSFIVSQRSDLDFFTQPLTIHLSGISLSTVPSEHSGFAFIALGRSKTDQLSNYFTAARWYEGGLIVQLRRHAGQGEIQVRWAWDGSGSRPQRFALEGFPTDLTLTVDGASKTCQLRLAGAVFADTGEPVRSVRWTHLDTRHLTVNGAVFTRLAIGAIQSDERKTTMTIDSVNVVAGGEVSQPIPSAPVSTPIARPGNRAWPFSIATESGVAIYRPGEAMGLQLTAGEEIAEPKTLHYRVVLRRSEGEQPGAHLSEHPVSGQTEASAGDTIPMALSAPSVEGVYWAEIEMEMPAPQAASTVARMQFVVIDPALKPQTAAELKERLIADIDGAADPDPDRYIDDGETRVEQTPLGAFRTTATRARNVYPPSNDPHNITRDNMSWFAYRLEIENPGKAHRIEVTYPDDDLRSMGISLYQPDKLNQQRGLQISSGVITGGDFPNSHTERTHAILFWPTGDHVLVLITNRLPGKRAAMGRIRLYELPGGLPPADLEATAPAERRIGLFYEEARAPDNFGGRYGPVGAHRGPVRGWEFFYDSAKNMTEYMRHAGMNALLYLVHGYLDTIYPSALSPMRGRYDNQLPSDPFRKDVVELYLRLFDRDDSIFIPQIKFADLPGNAIFEARMEAAGIPESEYRCLNEDGQLRGPGNAGGPLYDPLSPHWQAYVRDVVREIAERYQHHRAFPGVDIRLVKSVTAILYPDMHWGYGDTVLAAFERDSGITLPGEPDSPDRFALRKAVLQGEHREAFIRWRQERVAAFIGSIAAELAAIRPDLKLYLSVVPGTVIPDPRWWETTARIEQPDWDAVEYRREMALDLEAWADIPNLVLVPYRRDGGHFLYQTVPLNRPAHYLKEVDMNPDWLTPYAKQNRPLGLVSYYTYFESRLDDFAIKAKEKWDYDHTQVWLVGTHVPTEPFEREPFARALNHLNPDLLLWGGFHAPAGREDGFRRFARAFRALPPGPFEKSPHSVQPVGVHTAIIDGKGWAYIVNESFAPAKVSLTFACPQAQALTREPESLETPVQAGQALMELDLEPYSLTTLRTDQGMLELHDMTVEPGAFYIESLQQRAAEVDHVLRQINDAKARHLSAQIDRALAESRWTDLWKFLNSAAVYNAFAQAGRPERSPGEAYFGLDPNPGRRESR